MGIGGFDELINQSRAIMADIPSLKFDTGDLKLRACASFAYADMNIPYLETKALVPVCTAYRFNVARIRFMMLLPAHIGTSQL